MRFEFEGEVWYWRGPSPFHFVTVPEDESAEIEAAAAFVTYGWGMIPVTVTLGDTTWATALWPKDGRYIVPLKSDIRKAEGVELGMVVTIGLLIDA